MPYLIIIVVVLITSPFILKLAQSQKKEAKRKLKLALLVIITAQLNIGLLNWENFTIGRSGFELSLTYPNSFLGLFFTVSLIQIILLAVSKSFNTTVVVLNFINTILLFICMIRLSSILEFQAASFASISVSFLVLVGNVVGLSLINKDKNLLKKYFRP